MAFTKVVGAGIHTLSNITSHNINSSGIITATKFVGPIEGNITAVDGVFTGNVSIAKTLTYEDVKNVDSVGVGTFREGIFIPNEKKAEFGGASGTRLEIYHSSSNSNNSFIKHTSSGALKIAADHFRFRNAADSSNLFNGLAGGAITLYYSGQEKLKTISDGIEVPDAIRHINDTNTAIRFPADDTFSVETGGSERFRIDPNGHITIGIGASSVNNSYLTIPRYSADGDTIRLISQRSDSAPADLSFVKSRSTTYGSYAATQDDDFVMSINSYIDNGSALTYRGTYRSIYDTSTGGVHFMWGSGTSPSTTGEKMRLTATGNVGIGTKIPAAKFVVSNDGANGFEFNPNFNSNNSIIASYNRTGGGSYSQLTLSASQHIFAQGGTEYGRFDANGRLGIGTDNPDRMLHIKGTGNAIVKMEANYSGSVTGIEGVLTASGANRYVTGVYGKVVNTSGSESNVASIRLWNEQASPTTSDSPGYITFNTTSDGASTATEKLRITSTGDVNIGGNFTQTDSRVHIQDVTRPLQEGTLTLSSASTTDGAANNGSTLRFHGHDGSTERYQASIRGAKENGTSGNYAGYLAFNTRPNGSGMVERLRITSAGFVQIGAAADAAEAPLHVTAENSQGINAIFGAKDFVVHNNYNYDDANIALQGRDAGDNDTGAGIQFTTRNTGDSNWLHGAFTQDTSGHFRFITGGAGTTAGTTKVTITSGGKVGINEPSPSGFLTVRATTDDNPSIVLYRNSGGGDVASLNWKSSTGTNAFIKWRGGGGDMGMHFYTSNAGNDGSTSEKIRIASTGQLLVHTGSNASGSIVMGGNYDGLGQTNSTAKLGTLMMPHYTNAEEPIQIIRGYSDSARNLVSIGGGTNSANAATEIELLTATSITGNGLARLSIDSNGKAVFSARTRTPQLGIGVEAQDHVHLHVESTDPRVLIKSTGTNASKIWFGDSGATDRGIIEYQHTNDAMRFGTAGTEDRLVIKGDGKIAIGAPAFTAGSILHMKASGAYLTIEGTGGTDYQGIKLSNSGGNHGQIWFNGSSQSGYGGANSLNLYNSANNPIAFYQATNKRGELASTGNWVLYTSLYASTSSSTINGNGALMGKLGNKSLGSDVWGAGKGTTQFYVYGDSDKYYPVELFPAGSAWNTRIQIWRGYSEHGPNDWNTSTHKGGLTFDFSVRFGSWGGYTQHGPQIYYFGESYATLVGGLAYVSHSMRYCIWLRGGGSGGARYNIDSPSGNLSFIVHDDVTNTGTGSGYYYSDVGTAGEGNNTSNVARGWATYYHSNASYRYYVDYIGNSTTLTNYRNNLKQYNLTGAHTTHGGGAHNP